MKLPLCLTCKHLLPDNLPGKGMACAAFPEGIPFPIQWGDANHRDPYEGDHGIRFEPIAVEIPAKAGSSR